MVSVLALSAVDRGFEPRLVQTKVYKIGIYCFSTKHAAFKFNNPNWLSQNQDDVSEWRDISTLRCYTILCGLVCYTGCCFTIKIYPSVCLVQKGHHYHLIEM